MGQHSSLLQRLPHQLGLDSNKSDSGGACKDFRKGPPLGESKHFNPVLNAVDWDALVRSRRDQILGCTEPEVF